MYFTSFKVVNMLSDMYVPKFKYLRNTVQIYNFIFNINRHDTFRRNYTVIMGT